MDSQSKNIFKTKLIEEVNKLKPNIPDKNLEELILKVSKEYSVEISKNIKQVDKNNVFDSCSLDFEINLVQSKNLPASNHLIGHRIVGGLRIPGRPLPINPNDLWNCSLGVSVEKNNTIIELLIYKLSSHLNENTFNEACQKSGVSLKREEIDERTLANAIFYHKGLKIINEF